MPLHRWFQISAPDARAKCRSLRSRMLHSYQGAPKGWHIDRRLLLQLTSDNVLRMLSLCYGSVCRSTAVEASDRSVQRGRWAAAWPFTHQLRMIIGHGNSRRRTHSENIMILTVLVTIRVSVSVSNVSTSPRLWFTYTVIFVREKIKYFPPSGGSRSRALISWQLTETGSIIS